MIINAERIPEISLYYLGAIILGQIKTSQRLSTDDIYIFLKEQIEEFISIDYVYLALDWLFLLGLVNFNEGMIIYDN